MTDMIEQSVFSSRKRPSNLELYDHLLDMVSFSQGVSSTKKRVHLPTHRVCVPSPVNFSNSISISHQSVTIFRYETPRPVTLGVP